MGGGGFDPVARTFAAFPTTAPATLFGTNKLASIVGTTSAAVQYSRRVEIPWRVAAPGALAALVGSWYGAKAVAYLDPAAILRPLILALLVFGGRCTFPPGISARSRASRSTGTRSVAIGLGVGGVIGFYDGFFFGLEPGSS